MGALALINHAFDDGDKTWERDWLQNRMRYVESAQNMAFDISGALEFSIDFSDTIYYTASAPQVREYKKTTERLKEENSLTVDITANGSAESQTLDSGIFGGDCRDWLQSQKQKQEEVEANTEENSAMTEMLHFQEQRRMRKEQMEAWAEQQEVNKSLLTAAEELREELALLKKQRQQ
ncbi:hypothetical protein BGX24_012394 [Mortierella sp. AD032]|nr:hypothetical protein BGX24_012394 [Mortierella sp. AD032]